MKLPKTFIPPNKDKIAEKTESLLKTPDGLDGFVYVPELKFYVAEKILTLDDRVQKIIANLTHLELINDGLHSSISEKFKRVYLNHLTNNIFNLDSNGYPPKTNFNLGYLYDINWFEAKLILKHLGSRMLTLAEFWKFYDYCEQNRPDIINKGIKNAGAGEWFDTLIKGKDRIIINADVTKKGSRYSYKGGLEKETNFLRKTKLFPFKKDEVNEDGLPEKIARRYVGDCVGFSSRHNLKAVRRVYGAFNDNVNYIFYASPFTLDKRIGVREVREIGK